MDGVKVTSSLGRSQSRQWRAGGEELRRDSPEDSIEKPLSFAGSKQSADQQPVRGMSSAKKNVLRLGIERDATSSALTRAEL